LEDIEEDQTMIRSVKHVFISEACSSQHNNKVNTFDVQSENEAAWLNYVSSQIDEILAHLLSVSPTLVLEVYAARLVANSKKGHQFELLTPALTMNIELRSLDFDELFQAEFSGTFASKTKGV
jgi:hypothetical protein